MKALITSLVGKFDAEDQDIKQAFQNLKSDAQSASANVSQDLNVVMDLLQQTLAVQISNNQALAASALLIQVRKAYLYALY
jgi:hypothetical protein